MSRFNPRVDHGIILEGSHLVDKAGTMSREENSPPPRQSPYSPFPFGSPLATMAARDKSSSASNHRTNNGHLSNNTSVAFGSSPYLKGRVRAQEAYGGKKINNQPRTHRIDDISFF